MMNNLTTKETAIPWPAILALVVDGATILVAGTLLSDLTTRLSSPSGLNTLLVSAVYVLFALGVYLMRRLKPMPDGAESWASPQVRGVLAVLFGLALTTAVAWQLGFFSSIEAIDMDQIGEGPSSAFFVFAPGAWLGFSMLYILVLAFPVTPTVPYASARYSLFALYSLVVTNVMLVVLAVQASVMLPVGSSWAWAVPAAVGLALLFGPPRLFYASRTHGLGSRAGQLTLATFLALILALCVLVFVV